MQILQISVKGQIFLYLELFQGYFPLYLAPSSAKIKVGNCQFLKFFNNSQQQTKTFVPVFIVAALIRVWRLVTLDITIRYTG